MSTEKAFIDAQTTGTGRAKFFSLPWTGAVAYASTGTNTTTVAGTILWAEIDVTRGVTMKGVAVLNGATAGTDKGVVALYDNSGALVANSALAGATTSGANAFQSYDFTATVNVPAGRYFIAYQSNGTTDTVRTIAASTYPTVSASATGTFGTLTALTVPTTFTADKAPVGYAYTI